MPALVATQRLAALSKGGGVPAGYLAVTYKGQPVTRNGKRVLTNLQQNALFVRN